MSEPEAPTQSVPVIDGRMFVVTNGANLGDGLSFAEDLVLDDIYRLSETALRKRLTLCPEGTQFRIAPDTEIGQPGAVVCLDSALTLMTLQGDTTDALVLVELDAEGHVAASYLVPLAALKPRTDYALVGIDTDGARASLAQIACVSFTRGTHITMADGSQRRIETLTVGDRVLTRNAGAQQIRWIGKATARAAGELAPICIRAGTLNNAHDLVVSPDHRLFIYQRRDRIGAGRPDILVKARHLVNGDSVTVIEGGYVEYFQLLFDDHHMIFAEGIAAESFLYDPLTAPALPDDLTLEPAKRPRSVNSFPGLDVNEQLLDRPDAVELLRRSSTTG